MNCDCNLDKKALLELADKLEKVPRKNFNMGWWFKSNGTPLMGCPQSFVNRLKKHECGMTACLGGWAKIFFPKKFKGICGEVIFHRFKSVFGLCNDHGVILTTNLAPHQTPKQAAKAIRKLVGE